MATTYIHTTHGNYLGFISGDSVFSRDGEYLGWIEGGAIIWDKDGNYRGNLHKIDGNNYILRPVFSINPIPRIPRIPPIPPIPPIPAKNLVPIVVPLGFQDGFTGA